MTISSKRPSLILAGTLGSALLILSGCEEPVDIDLRGGKALNTSAAAAHATADRPQPDARGIISYPGYQVAVARRGDTVASVAQRIGVSPNELATYNGVQPGDQLRDGEVLALKNRVPEPTGGPIRPSGPVDIASVAGPAITQAKEQSIQTSKLEPVAKVTPAAQPAPKTVTVTPAEAAKQEPVRHQVKRGETAYSISRLYNVSLRSLADWNGLDAQYTVREGQFLLIPVALEGQKPPVRKTTVRTPGAGSTTPVPPSATRPLPKEDLKPTVEAKAEADAEPSAAPDLGKTQTAATSSKMLYPVNGDIVREYAKGRNDGIDIAAPAGSTVVVADAGTVAAVTEDTNGVPIVVVKHSGDLLTIYSNVDKVNVKKGSKVKRGQSIASTRSDNTAVHFEIRKGFDSVNPLPYLN